MLTIPEYRHGTPEAVEIVKRDARTAPIVHCDQRHAPSDQQQAICPMADPGVGIGMGEAV